VALNEPVVAEAATVTLAGTVTLALLLLRTTVVPPAGAAPLRVTVHALLPGPVKEAGVHTRPLTIKSAFNVIVEVALPPLALADNVAAESLAIVPAVAEKPALVPPAATVTVAGAVSSALFEESAT